MHADDKLTDFIDGVVRRLATRFCALLETKLVIMSYFCDRAAIFALREAGWL